MYSLAFYFMCRVFYCFQRFHIEKNTLMLRDNYEYRVLLLYSIFEGHFFLRVV
jgi:hypothetical protein